MEALKNLLRENQLKIFFLENYIFGDKDEFIKVM